jgi:hypothetical protein
MRIAVIRTQGIGALSERPPELRVKRCMPGTATTTAFSRSGLELR